MADRHSQLTWAASCPRYPPTLFILVCRRFSVTGAPSACTTALGMGPKGPLRRMVGRELWLEMQDCLSPGPCPSLACRAPGAPRGRHCSNAHPDFL